MKQVHLQHMTVDQLVERFLAIALDQDRAMFNGNHAKYNRLYGQMDAIKQELKSRPDDQRRALVPLHTHPNAQVRLKSAIATLTLAPEAARRTLQVISDRKRISPGGRCIWHVESARKGDFHTQLIWYCARLRGLSNHEAQQP